MHKQTVVNESFVVPGSGQVGYKQNWRSLGVQVTSIFLALLVSMQMLVVVSGPLHEAASFSRDPTSRALQGQPPVYTHSCTCECWQGETW